MQQGQLHTFSDTLSYRKDSYISRHSCIVTRTAVLPSTKVIVRRTPPFPDTADIVERTATLLDIPCVVMRTTVLCEDYFLIFIYILLHDTVSLYSKKW